MAALNSSSFRQLLDRLTVDFPEIQFRSGSVFMWSPRDKEVVIGDVASNSARWSLLHETAHALLNHHRYRSDIELVRMESEAWHKAEQLGDSYEIDIPTEHIDDCMDTYRDWLHARSRCPQCTQIGLQADRHTYACINCHQSWRVTDHKFKRPYRLCIPNKTTPA